MIKLTQKVKFLYQIFSQSSKRPVFLLNSSFSSNCCDDPNHNHTHIQDLKKKENLKTRAVSNPQIAELLKSDKFQEKSFIKEYLNAISSNLQYQNEEDMKSLLLYLENNINHLNTPNSIVAIIDKLKFVKNDIVPEKLFEKCLNQGYKIFIKSYKVKSDDGNLVRALVLVSALMKKEKKNEFFVNIMEFVSSNLSFISLKNLLIITESFILNKIFLNEDLLRKNLIKNFGKLEQIKLGDLEIYSKLIRIITYVLKNKNVFDKVENENFVDKNLIQIFQKVLKNLYNSFLNVFFDDKSSFDVLILCEIANFLEILSSHINDRDLKMIHSKFIEQYNKYIEKRITKDPHYLKEENITLFLSKFFEFKPVIFNKQILQGIISIFQKQTFTNLKDFTLYFYFIAKNSPNFIVSISNYEQLNKLITTEKNLLVLSKLMEAIISSERVKPNNKVIFEAQEGFIKKLEERFFSLCGQIKQSNVITLPLLIFAQGLSILNRGTTENWIYLFKYFSNPHILQNLDYIELFVKLLPTAGNKSRLIFKVPNQPTKPNKSNWSSNLLKNDELNVEVDKFWDVMEDILINNLERIYYDKYTIILMQFTRANLRVKRNVKIFNAMKDKILENFLKFNIKQISEIAYAYARISQRFEEFFYLISEKDSEIKICSDEMLEELINLYWAFAAMKIENESTLQILEEKILKKIDKTNTDTLTEFIQAYSILNKYTNERLQVFSKLCLNELEKKEINLFNVFQQCYSFLIMQNFDLEFWKRAIEFINLTKESFITNKLFLSYLYLIFIHLKFSHNPIAVALDQELNQIEGILRLEKNNLISYLINEKLTFASRSEDKFIELMKKHITNLFKNDYDNENAYHFVEQNNFKLLFCDKFDILNEERFTKGFFEEFYVIPYLSDFRFTNNCLVEYNGRNHYLFNETKKRYEIDGITKLKKDFLDKNGFKYLEAPFWRVGEDVNPEKALELIKEIINKAK